jgi:hypothetical protein
VSGQLHISAALSPGKEPAVPIGEEARWAPEPVWPIWRSENFIPYKDSNSCLSIVSRYTDCATLHHVVL